MYSSTLSLTSAVGRGGWSKPRPGRFTRGERDPVPITGVLGGPQGRSGPVRKISPPSGFDPRTVQPVKTLRSLGAQTVRQSQCYRETLLV
jgi:hypothetical protein